MLSSIKIKKIKICNKNLKFGLVLNSMKNKTNKQKTKFSDLVIEITLRITNGNFGKLKLNLYK